MTKRETERLASLMPNGIPKYVRIYDNADTPSETCDRYSVVYSGNYNNIGRPRNCYKQRYYGIRFMSYYPRSPNGVCLWEDSSTIIDTIPGRWGGPKIGQSCYSLGKRIRFEELPEQCTELVIEDYRAIWRLS